jgi:hypothetical protein
MIGIVSVIIRRGELTTHSQLRDLACGLFPNAAPSGRRNHTEEAQRYIDDLPSAYTCVPKNHSRATFVWHDARSFEVIVETFPSGKLLATLEAVVRELALRFEQLHLRAEITLTLRGTNGFQTVAEGKPTSPARHFWSLMKENIVLVIIALALIPISKAWLPSYFDEARAVALSLAVLLVWRGNGAFSEAQGTRINWTVNERAE